MTDQTPSHRLMKLVQTCSACPEQYDVFNEAGAQVGYLRLRHGLFTASVPDAGGIDVYVASPNGDGVFESDERDGYIRAALAAIAAHDATDCAIEVEAAPLDAERYQMFDYDAEYGWIVENDGEGASRIVAENVLPSFGVLFRWEDPNDD